MMKHLQNIAQLSNKDTSSDKKDTYMSVLRPVLKKAYSMAGLPYSKIPELKQLANKPAGEGILEDLLSVVTSPAAKAVGKDALQKALPIAKKLLSSFAKGKLMKKHPKIASMITAATSTSQPKPAVVTSGVGMGPTSADSSSSRLRSGMVYSLAALNNGEDVSSL
jgi:hypothetical protein